MEDHRILARIIKDYPDVLSDRRKLQALLSDFFPENRLKRNILLMVYDDGIVGQLSELTRLDSLTLQRFVRSVGQGYGIQAQNAEAAILAWAGALGVAADTGQGVRETAAPCDEESGCAANENAYEYEDTPRGIKLLRYIDFDDMTVKLPDRIGGRKVTEVGNHAFKGCVGIEKIIVPEGIEVLGNGVFLNCKELREVVLPGTLKRIGTADTDGCPKILGTMTKLEGAFENTALESVTVPDSVKYIGEYTFSGCLRLRSVTLPAGLREIRDYTFCWCRSLQEITFPAELEAIGTEAFEGCESLETVILPEGVSSIAQGAFAGCKALRRIYLPDSVSEIGGGRGSGFIQTFGQPEDRHQDFTILCNAGSYAMGYARKQQIRCARAQL